MVVGEFEWDDAVEMGIAGLAGVLFLIALKAYLRTRTARVGLFAAAFGMFFVKGLLKVVEVFWVGDTEGMNVAELLAEASVLLLFFVGVLRD